MCLLQVSSVPTVSLPNSPESACDSFAPAGTRLSPGPLTPPSASSDVTAATQLPQYSARYASTNNVFATSPQPADDVAPTFTTLTQAQPVTQAASMVMTSTANNNSNVTTNSYEPSMSSVDMDVDVEVEPLGIPESDMTSLWRDVMSDNQPELDLPNTSPTSLDATMTSAAVEQTSPLSANLPLQDYFTPETSSEYTTPEVNEAMMCAAWQDTLVGNAFPLGAL